ncbi:MAG: PcfJ domain-containing protein [Hyphomicrobiaceae bacterium]
MAVAFDMSTAGAASQGPGAQFEIQIKRFRRTFRKRLRKLARVSDRLTELVVTYPGAAFAIATAYGTIEQRAAAIRLIKDGQSLRLVTKTLGLPIWFRKLPPEAFTEVFTELPCDERINQRLAGHVPADAEQTALWLKWVLEAYRECDHEFALWIACQDIFSGQASYAHQIAPLASFAWFSDRADTAAGALIVNRWTPKMSFVRAVDLAFNWIERIKSEVFLGTDGLSDTWLSGGRAAGYRFVPLTTNAELDKEGAAMNNCARAYADAIAQGRCRLFGVRRGCKHVATLEIQPHCGHPGIPAIVQLLGPSNEEVPDRIWKAAFTWLAKQSRYGLPETYVLHAPVPIASVWRKLWRPYWCACGANFVLPEEPDSDTVPGLEQRLLDLRGRN